MTAESFRRSRAAWLFSVLMALIFVVAGCATTGSPQGAPAPSKAHKHMTKVFVQLNWLSNVEFSGLWVADHKGWFKKAGFKFTFKSWSNGIDPEGTTAACYQGGGKLCFGFDDSAAVAIARDNGDKLKAIWVGSQKTPFGFATCKVPKTGTNKKCKSNTGKNITKPSQWAKYHLKIGYQSHELYVPEIMLGKVHKSLSDVTPKTVQFDTSALTTGAVDAFLVFINNEPIALKLQGVKTNVIPAYKWGMQDFYADTMFAPDAELAHHSKKVAKFVSLVDKGWKYAMHHYKSVAHMVVKNYFPTEFGVPSNKKQQVLEEKKFATTLSRDSKGRISGRMTLKRWKGIIHILATYPGDLGGKPILHNPLPSAKKTFTDKFAPPPAK